MSLEDAAAAHVHVLGAGLAGLAAAIELGDSCRVIEADERPGGLVRAHAVEVSDRGRFWFDHVLHLLYFPDSDTEQRVLGLAGEHLARCPPVAYVETPSGTTRYPLQMHLAGLPLDTRVRCLLDLIELHGRDESPPENLEQALLQTFGRGLCETFLFPYNRKTWGLPLDTLRGQLAWTVTRPDLEQVLRGAMRDGADFTSYNAQGWYPRPPADAPVRGMEVLSAALAAQVANLDTNTRVTAIDPARGTLHLAGPGGAAETPYRTCIATAPLPQLLAMVRGVPDDLLSAVRRLRRNRVWSVALCLDGESREDTGQWRYYSDESLCFTRLVFMHAFDPGTVPAGCAGVMAEIPEAVDAPAMSEEARIARVIEDARRAGAIGAHQRVLATKVWCIDPAYVVFDNDTADIVGAARDWLESQRIHALGRYGLGILVNGAGNARWLRARGAIEGIMLTTMIATLAFGLAAGCAATAAVIWAARRIGFTAGFNPIVPQERLPAAMGGGLGIAVGLTVALGLAVWLGFAPGGILLVAAAAAPALLVGLVDDARPMSPQVKLPFQILAAVVGLAILIGLPQDLAGWIIGAAVVFGGAVLMNAFNFLDVSDGYTGSIAVVCFGGLALCLPGGTAAMAVIGGCLGFLVFNWAPARIYMGDAGTLLLGMLGTILLVLAGREMSVTSALGAGVVCFAVPLLELAGVTAIRWHRGISIWRGSPDHSALRLQRAGLSKRQAALVTCAFQAVLVLGYRLILVDG